MDSDVPSGVSRPSGHVLNADKAKAPEEVKQPRDIRTTDVPTQAETAEHKDGSHALYRDWCPDCVEGFGHEWAHKQSMGKRLVPLFSFDYVHISPSGVFARDELSEEERTGSLKGHSR